MADLNRVEQSFNGAILFGKLKRLLSRLARALKPLEIDSPAVTALQDVDPRICGEANAFRRGWYRSETGELFGGFKVTADDIVLDVGCGDGPATLFCAEQGAHVVFLDVDATKIKALIEKANETKARKVEGFVSDSAALPLPDEYATKILSMELLEHTLNPEKILAELVRVGKLGAQYFITVPDSRSEGLQKAFADPIYFSEPNHIQIFDKESFVRLVENSGLKVERYDSWGFYWTVYMSLFWTIHQGKSLHGVIFDDYFKPPFHPVLQSWSNTWAGLMELNGSGKLLESFDKYLPKVQIIIAKKV